MHRFRQLRAACFLVVVASATATERGHAHCAGLCNAPRIEQIVVAPSGDDLVVRTNFGLLARQGERWVHYCYEQLGGSVYSLVGEPGNIAIASAAGISKAGADLCQLKPAGEGLVSSWIIDLSAARGRPNEVLALTSDSLGSAVFLQSSSDGAATFHSEHRFSYDAAYSQALSSGGLDGVTYLAGYTFSPRGFRILHSTVAGGWSSSAHGLPDSVADFRLLGAAEDAPSVVFVLKRRTGAKSETVWRSSDFGHDMVAVLDFATDETLAGFTFGETQAEIYVATQSPAHSSLYRSTDKGRSFTRVSAGLPRLSCLSFSRRSLVACAAELAPDAPFFVARSQDLGASWTPLLRPVELTSAAACDAKACAETAHVLCEVYGLCASPAVSDGSVHPNPEANGKGGGGCSVVAPPAQPSAIVGALAALVASLILRRRQ